MATAATPESGLPKKEQELFRTLVNCYETKKYKKGIKNAETILKKYPNHGETLAMKGLITNCLGQKAKAYELVKLGVRNAVRSHICWHVFGLLHKSDKNLKEASKCYLNALRIDPANQGILRDLSALQVQIRDIAGFVITRRKILDTKPTITSSWVAFAAGNYLGGQYSVAFDVVAKFFEGATNEKIIKSPEEKHAESELVMFQSRCLEVQNKFDEAIIHLRQQQGRLVDVLAFRVKQAELLVLSGRYSEASIMWDKLVREQGENYRFHCGLQTTALKLDVETAKKMFLLRQLELPSTSLQLSDEQADVLMELYEKRTYKSRAMGKILLTIARGDQLKELLEAHIRKSLHDEVPALYQDVFSLVRDSSNSSITDCYDFKSHPVTIMAVEMVDRFLNNLTLTETLDPFSESPPNREAPGVLLWSMVLQAHLLARCGDVTQALCVVNACLEHTPTALDVHSMKARLLKKSGDVKAAAEVMDYCRSLDLQDRYLNNKATKYFLRSNQIQDGMETIAMFTKHEGDAEKILFDLQANWYEAELGEAYSRTKQWGPALKKFSAIQKHFQDYIDDMSDFHGFCLRKQTLRSYCDVLAMQDTVYSHPFLQRAARGTISILLHLLDCPEDIDGLGHLSAADRKKEKAKVKKRKEKEMKAFEEKEKAQADEAKWNGKESSGDEIKDSDPFGEKILQRNFLAECGVWCDLVAPFRVNNETICSPETLVLVCDVMIRKGKYLPAVRALSCGLKTCPFHPALSVMLVRLSLKVGGGGTVGGTAPIEVKTVMQTVVAEEMALLLGGVGTPGILAFAEMYAQHARTISSLPHRIAAARIRLLADKVSGKAAAEMLLLEDGVCDGRGVTVSTLDQAISFLVKDLKLSPGSAEVLALKGRAALLFPLSDAFTEHTQSAEIVV